MSIEYMFTKGHWEKCDKRWNEIVTWYEMLNVLKYVELEKVRIICLNILCSIYISTFMNGKVIMLLVTNEIIFEIWEIWLCVYH